MAANFKIYIHRNSENIHLKLFGDFDGSSAYELLNTLKNKCSHASKIFVHTGCLNQIHPFGRDVFHNNLNTLNVRPHTVLFTGEEASQLLPENDQSFRLVA